MKLQGIYSAESRFHFKLSSFLFECSDVIYTTNPFMDFLKRPAEAAVSRNSSSLSNVPKPMLNYPPVLNAL